MKKIIILGIISAFFFSSTFVINRWLSINGGHWFWTASLRYIYVFILLSIFIIISKGLKTFNECIKCFTEFWYFWIFAGGIGYGLFYILLCFSASYAPGWIIAATWQFTILASPIVLFFLGEKVPIRGITYLVIIFVGICFVNFQNTSNFSFNLLYAVLPVIIASFCYPLGNNLCKYATEGRYLKLHISKYKCMENSFCQVLVMTIGALPLLFVLGVYLNPIMPNSNQLLSVLYIALSTGVIATSIFYWARKGARNAYEIAAVDSTQAAEVPFSLLIGWFLFHDKTISILGFLGLILIIFGITLFTLRRDKKTSISTERS